MEIITNNVPRFILYGYELTAKEAAAFSHYSADELSKHSFFRYRGEVYALIDFMRTGNGLDAFAEWHGYHSETYFSGIVVRYVDDSCEQVIVGRYYA
jgi:hypothetical protein